MFRFSPVLLTLSLCTSSLMADWLPTADLELETVESTHAGEKLSSCIYGYDETGTYSFALDYLNPGLNLTDIEYRVDYIAPGQEMAVTLYSGPVNADTPDGWLTARLPIGYDVGGVFYFTVTSYYSDNTYTVEEACWSE